MKPISFDYFAPSDLSDALALVDRYGTDAKILAGGQSLMPLMNMRLVRPRTIIDINRISQLEHISPGREGGLVIGALARQRALERSALVREKVLLLAKAVPYIGHFQIRNRGTIGGSMAHADPAAELPALAVALDAELALWSTRAQRLVKAEDFFLGPLTTAIEPTEVLTEVLFPTWDARWRQGFQEFTRREGDFALVGAIVLLQIDGDGPCQAARIVMFGAGSRPVRMRRAEAAVVGQTVDRRALEALAELVAEELEPESDIHASAEYRKEVGGALARRAAEAALSN